MESFLIGFAFGMVMFTLILIVGIIVMENVDLNLDEHYVTSCLSYYNNTTQHPIIIKNDSGVYCKLQNDSYIDMTIRDALV